VAGAIELFEAAMDATTAELGRGYLPILCEAGEHRLLMVDGDATVSDHDLEAEASLHALGGEPPGCIAARTALADASMDELWTAITAESTATTDSQRVRDLLRLPNAVLRLVLARRLWSDFALAGVAARHHVAQFGLSVLSPSFRTTPALRTRFRAVQAMPRWPTTGNWTEAELAVLGRYFRFDRGTGVVSIDAIPRDKKARRVVGRCIAERLEARQQYSRADVRDLLGTLHHNSAAAVTMLLAEGLLVETNAGYALTDNR
jgi:hypothetical protein